MRVFWSLTLLGGIGCTSPTAPSRVYQVARWAVTDSAARWVAHCAAQDRLALVRPYSTLRFWLDPSIKLGGRGQGRDAYVQAPLANYPVLWAHEFLHLMYGLPGKTATDHPGAFWRCGLDPRQY